MFPDSKSASARLFARGQKLMPGGGTRHPMMFPPYLVFAASSSGAYLTDVDGVERLDFINNFSCQIHGHGNPEIAAVIAAQARGFTSAILPTECELQLGELIQSRVPGIERIRFCNSGTEAMMIAVKAARGYTRRPRILKMEGGYHGQYPELETSVSPTPGNWGPVSEPHRVPLSDDTPPELLANVVVAPFNNVEATRALIHKYRDSLAAVVIDPLPSRMQFVKASDEFLQMLRSETARHGILLVFDEVYSFRLGYHGAQGRYGITPDLTGLGKIIGGGLPVGAIGGREEVMAVFSAPSANGWARVFHGGTFTANPMSMSAGRRALELLTPEAFASLEEHGERLRAGLRDAAKRVGVPIHVLGEGSLSGVAFCEQGFDNYRDMVSAMGPRHREYLLAFHRGMLNRGVILSPGGVFAGSTAMTRADIDAAVRAAEGAFADVAQLMHA
jgi:glutamate-1-semialdehyde 2,1-aminomutase